MGLRFTLVPPWHQLIVDVCHEEPRLRSAAVAEERPLAAQANGTATRGAQVRAVEETRPGRYAAPRRAAHGPRLGSAGLAAPLGKRAVVDLDGQPSRRPTRTPAAKPIRQALWRDIRLVDRASAVARSPPKKAGI